MQRKNALPEQSQTGAYVLYVGAYIDRLFSDCHLSPTSEIMTPHALDIVFLNGRKVATNFRCRRFLLEKLISVLEIFSCWGWRASPESPNLS